MPQAVSKPRPGRSVLALCMLALFAGSAATPEYGTGAPRNGAGQPVNPTLGTPLPGDAPISG